MSDWTARRFWTTVDVAQTEDGFAVTLDGRFVKTPLKTPLTVPYKAMAEAIAVEWEAQGEKIDPLSMPVTRSANAALDKVWVQHAEVAALIAAYGENDLLCYRATSPKELIDRQAKHWDPILDWAAQALQAPLIPVAGVMHQDQPASSVAVLRALVERQNAFELTALHDLVSISGSLVIGFAAQQKAFDLSVLWYAAQLDENWQIEQWGRDDEADATSGKKRAAFEHADRFYKLTQGA